MDHPFLLKSLIYLRYVKVSWLEMRHVPPKAVACVLHLYLVVPVILMSTCNKELNLMIIVSHYPAPFPLLQGSVLLKLVTLCHETGFVGLISFASSMVHCSSLFCNRFLP